MGSGRVTRVLGIIGFWMIASGFVLGVFGGEHLREVAGTLVLLPFAMLGAGTAANYARRNGFRDPTVRVGGGIAAVVALLLVLGVLFGDGDRDPKPITDRPTTLLEKCERGLVDLSQDILVDACADAASARFPDR